MTLTKRLLMLVILFIASVSFAEDSVVVSKDDKPVNEMDQLKQQIQRLEDKLQKMDEENDIRRRLESTDEEKKSSEDAILEAAGTDYTLMKPGKLGFEYSAKYQGDSYDSITDSGTVEHNSFHTWTNSLFIEYPLKENLTLNTSIPFVYKSKSQSNSSTAKDVSDLGDVSLGCQFQPVKSGEGLPSIIISGAFNCPTGRSPYKIDTTREISTGSGYYGIDMGLNISKSIDPLVAFGGVNYSKGIPVSHLNFKTSPTDGESGTYIRDVDPGDSVSASMGIGYSLSYQVSLTLGYQYSYQMATEYTVAYESNGVVGSTTTASTPGTISSVFSIGTAWNISPKRSFNVRLGIGLTNNDSDFSVMVRIPFSYDL